MDADSIRARIEHETAELRARYPQMTRCDSALCQGKENGRARYSLYLDLRWPDRQVLVSGPARDDAAAAIDAACHAARERIDQATWASR
jgi:hypothetical protein